MDHDTPTRPPTAAIQERHPSTRWHRNRRRLVLAILAVAAFVAAMFFLGPEGLIPYGLLLAFSIDSDDEAPWRSVRPTPRNLALAAVMAAACAWFWLGYSAL